LAEVKQVEDKQVRMISENVTELKNQVNIEFDRKKGTKIL
jgi:hypothetical protein